MFEEGTNLTFANDVDDPLRTGTRFQSYEDMMLQL
jgi:hypothetical protein